MTKQEQRFFNECLHRLKQAANAQNTSVPHWDYLDYVVAVGVLANTDITYRLEGHKDGMKPAYNKVREIEAEFSKHGWEYSRREARKSAKNLGLTIKSTK